MFADILVRFKIDHGRIKHSSGQVQLTLTMNDSFTSFLPNHFQKSDFVLLSVVHNHCLNSISKLQYNKKMVLSIENTVEFMINEASVSIEKSLSRQRFS